MRELIRNKMAEAMVRQTENELEHQIGIDASFEREPGLAETQQEHLPLLGDLIREHRAMVEERHLQESEQQSSFRMTMYQWGLRTWGRERGEA